MPSALENMSSGVGEDPSSLSSTDIDIDIVDDAWLNVADVVSVSERAIMAALSAFDLKDVPLELGCRLTSDADSHALNKEYRSKDKPTNVLSFVGVAPEMLETETAAARAGGPPLMLGDLVLAYGTVAHEAGEQGKSVTDHLSHLLVHGVLHLLSHDHIEVDAAEIMEALERNILEKMGIDDPYKDDETRL